MFTGSNFSTVSLIGSNFSQITFYKIYLGKLKKVMPNWESPGNFNFCFCVICNCYSQRSFTAISQFIDFLKYFLIFFLSLLVIYIYTIFMGCFYFAFILLLMYCFYLFMQAVRPVSHYVILMFQVGLLVSVNVI